MDTKPKILLIDDETAITANLAPFLERAGYSVVVEGDGAAGLSRINTFMPDLVVTDVLMPRMDGREFLRQLRKANNWTPVILLTQVGESMERAMALSEGADDYLNKPFDPHELVARIQAILRRVSLGKPSLAAAQKLISGELELERSARKVKLRGKEVSLTPKAVGLLEYLMMHPNELLTRERLLDAVWGWDYPTGLRTVDTRVAELRKVLNDDAAKPTYIETAPAQGYRFIGSNGVS